MSDDDDDQGLMPTSVCIKFECQRWDVHESAQPDYIRITCAGDRRADAPWRPKLVRDHETALWNCPCCFSSYGTNPHGDTFACDLAS